MKQPGHSVTRSVTINQQIIQYQLRYSRKAKYMRLQISRGSNLELVLPRGYELSDAERFIKQKADWIVKHIRKPEKGEDKYFLLGKEIKIVQEFKLPARSHILQFENGMLKVISPEGSKISAAKVYSVWLRNFAKRYLPERAELLADKYGFRINKVTIRNQKTRWGSCSVRGNLSFNFNLVQYKKEIVDYVIIHELCHLREMNHSKKFWSLVEKFCPDYKLLRKELKKNSDI